MLLPRSIAAVTLVLLSGATIAQTVYRCGQAYQDSPCPGGKAVDVGDERSDEQRESAHAVTEKDSARGNALEQGRLAREKAQRVANASNIGPQAKTAKHATERRSHAPKRARKKALKTRSTPKSQPLQPAA